MRTLFLFLILLISFPAMSQNFYQKEWRTVDSLYHLGQMESALKVIDNIYDQAKASKHDDQLIKALICRMTVEASFQDNYIEKAIEGTRLEIQSTQSPVKQILHSIVAELYWRYYQQNRWKILDRSQTVNFENTDMKTWDLRKIVGTCMEHYALSLSDKDLIKSTPISSFDEILDRNKDSEKYRPTLFDLLAFRAIDFYSSYEAGLTRPALTFNVDEAAYFSPYSQFTRLNIASPDSFSFDWQDLRLYQEVIGFHQKDADPSALIDADLARLSFVYKRSSLAEKDSLYLASLQQLAEQYKKVPSSSEIAYSIASFLLKDDEPEIYYEDDITPSVISEEKKWNRKKALEICQAAIDRFPDSFGAKNCLALKEKIQQASLNISVNEAVCTGKPSLALINYQNVSKVYFRLLKRDIANYRELQENGLDSLLEIYQNIKPQIKWKQALPDVGDYRRHSTEIKIPALQSGYYVLLASSEPTFTEKSALLNVNNFCVSNISYLSKTSNKIMVLHRETGAPLEGVKAEVYYRELNSGTRKLKNKPDTIYLSDSSGMVNIPPTGLTTQPYSFYIVFKSKDDQLISNYAFWSSSLSGNESPSYIKTHFFTDRAIYRPGQTVFFKGIVVKHTGKEVKVQPNFNTEVSFYDSNDKVISRQILTTNEYGSFSGNFTAPKGVLTGEMSIRNQNGNIAFAVEEYKRPKFEVTFPPVEGLYKLGQMIKMKGNARTYAGSAVSGAKVHYSVMRQAHFPYPWYNWRRSSYSQEMNISNGDTITNTDGSFDISFKAVPDSTTDAKSDVQFIYTVTADVTDINGESHIVETSIPVGYKALLVTTDLKEEINLEKEFHLSISTTNLNGKQEAASGTIQLYQLKKPQQVLYPRKWARPDLFTMSRRQFKKHFPGEVYSNEDDSTAWAREKVYSSPFSTPADSIIKPGITMKPGCYMIEIKTKDAFGEEVIYQKQFNAYAPQSGKTAIASPLSFTLLTPMVEPGQEALFLIATPIKNATVMYEIIQRNKVLSRVVLPLNGEQKLIRIPVTEEHRGNFCIQLTMVSNNHFFTETKIVEVPYTNKKLDIRFSTFRNKLMPGQEEEWQLVLSGPKGEKVAAEMLASMYDTSLDAFTPHAWQFNIYDTYNGVLPWNHYGYFGYRFGQQFNFDSISFPMSYRLYDQIDWFGFDKYGNRRLFNNKDIVEINDEEDMATQQEISFSRVPDSIKMTISIADVKGNDEENGMDIAELSSPMKSSVKFTPPIIKADEEVLDSETSTKTGAVPIQIRKNLNETAFFYPNLTTNEKGEIVIKFKAPEALTRWKVMGLAHTKDLKYGEIETTLITQKDLMIFTNAPRFMREGDHMDFSAKISNISNHDLSGMAELHFFDALTMHPIDSILGLTNTSTPFSATKGGSSPVSWKISIPEGLQAITYRITASAGSFSDGEEAAIPVLSNRMLVTESLPLPVKGNQTKAFTFAKLVNSNSVSSTLRSYRLTLEYTSNPAWYAVQALPYLMEFPHECAEQLFSRYYANSLATYIANSDPKIKRVFDSWKNSSPNSLKSNLEKNEELKSVLLQESPWVREATSETERRQRIALLFDLNKMASEQSIALKKLGDMQHDNGAWPWFLGMPESRYITQHIVTGLGHLYALKVINPLKDDAIRYKLSKAIEYLDTIMRRDFEKIKKQDKDYQKNNHLSYEDMQYLYARSYFMTTHPMGKDMDELLQYYKAQSVKYWNTQNNYMKGMVALYLNRYGDQRTAMLIVRSLKETALHHEETGMYWRDNRPSWYWFQAPIESQALLMEAFDEVSNDQQSVEEMKTWLLKQKQTQDWGTTRATTEAVYALLLRGTTLLASDKQVEITLDDEKVNPYKEGNIKPEAGTGYFKTSWDASSITPQMGKVTVTNPNPTIAWGAMYWQYFEQMDKITPAQTPLSLSKKLFREMDSPTGPVIEPITENATIHVGDRIVVRIELRADRSMEYLHLKDMRAAAFEPVNVLSGYHYQGGLGYYESTLDASTNFFISYLPKGTFVFEYKLTATQKGEFSNGITSIQCMYAPEFTSHSEGIRVRVKD